MNHVIAGVAMISTSACSIAAPEFRYSMVQAAVSNDKNGHYQLHGRSASALFSSSQDAELADAACSKDAAREVPALVKAGANANARGKQGISPLIWAMSCHNHQGIKALLEAGADPNLPMSARKMNDQGHKYWVLGQTNCAKRPFQGDLICQPPVYLASGGDDPKLLSILLKNDGDPNAVDQNFRSALMNAVSLDRVENMKLLIASGADVNYCPYKRCHGVLFSAANRFDMVMYMLNHATFTHKNLQEYADYYLSKNKPGSYGFHNTWPINDIKEYPYLRLYPKVVDYFKKKNIEPYQAKKVVLPPPDLSMEKAEEKKRQAYLKKRRQEGRPCPGNNAQIDSFGKYYCAPTKRSW